MRPRGNPRSELREEVPERRACARREDVTGVVLALDHGVAGAAALVLYAGTRLVLRGEAVAPARLCRHRLRHASVALAEDLNRAPVTGEQAVVHTDEGQRRHRA